MDSIPPAQDQAGNTTMRSLIGSEATQEEKDSKKEEVTKKADLKPTSSQPAQPKQPRVPSYFCSLPLGEACQLVMPEVTAGDQRERAFIDRERQAETIERARKERARNERARHASFMRQYGSTYTSLQIQEAEAQRRAQKLDHASFMRQYGPMYTSLQIQEAEAQRRAHNLEHERHEVRIQRVNLDHIRRLLEQATHSTVANIAQNEARLKQIVIEKERELHEKEAHMKQKEHELLLFQNTLQERHDKIREDALC